MKVLFDHDEEFNLVSVGYVGLVDDSDDEDDPIPYGVTILSDTTDHEISVWFETKERALALYAYLRAKAIEGGVVVIKEVAERFGGEARFF